MSFSDEAVQVIGVPMEGKGKDIGLLLICIAVAAGTFLIRDSIPEVGGINVASVIMSAAIAGGIFGVFHMLGLVPADKEPEEEAPENPEPENAKQERHMAVRVLAGFGWLIVIYLGTNILIGGAVGAVAGARNPDNAEQAGAVASTAFFTEYGLVILVAQLALFILLAAMGKLPGTTKYK